MNGRKQYVNFVCALFSEAKPLVEHFKLKKIQDKPFSLYTGSFCSDRDSSTNTSLSNTSVQVLISGIGSLNMASSVGWLGALQSKRAEDISAMFSQESARESSKRSPHINSIESIWLNVGIAGHASLNVGDPFLVSASTDVDSSRCYYPPQVARRTVPLSPCLSLNAPSNDYPEQGGIDMEASAFFNVASRFADAECVQSFKVVSDNPDHGLEELDAKRVTELMLPHVESAIDYSKNLLNLSVAEPSQNLDLAENLVQIVLSNIRCTHAQSQQLQKLCVQLGYLLPQQAMQELTRDVGIQTTIRPILAKLRDSLNSFEPTLGAD